MFKPSGFGFIAGNRVESAGVYPGQFLSPLGEVQRILRVRALPFRDEGTGTEFQHPIPALALGLDVGEHQWIDGRDGHFFPHLEGRANDGGSV